MKLINVSGRPLRPVAGGPGVPPGATVDLNSRDPQVARLIERGALRQPPRRPAPSAPPPDPEPASEQVAADTVGDDEEE